MDYLEKAAQCLTFANATASDIRRREYLEIADRLERLAAIERGLLPPDLATDQNAEQQP